MFITFEGGDGTGKSTLIEIVRKELESKGKDVILTREPGGTNSTLAEAIRALVLDDKYKNVNPYTEALLYAASRAQHIDDVIKKGLNEGKIVLCDRYIDSSIAYQAYGRNLGIEFIKNINQYAFETMPDITFYIDVDPKIGIERTKNRNKHDRLDQEKIDFHIKTRAGYLKVAKDRKNKKRIVIIDGNKTIDEIAKNIIEEINKRNG